MYSFVESLNWRIFFPFQSTDWAQEVIQAAEGDARRELCGFV
jgi:hypothetical protein